MEEFFFTAVVFVDTIAAVFVTVTLLARWNAVEVGAEELVVSAIRVAEGGKEVDKTGGRSDSSCQY